MRFGCSSMLNYIENYARANTGSPDRTGAGSPLRYAPPPFPLRGPSAGIPCGYDVLREGCYATDPAIPLRGTGVRPDKNRSPRAVRGAGALATCASTGTCNLRKYRHLQPAQVQAGGTPGRTGCRQAAPYAALRPLPPPGTFGGDLRRVLRGDASRSAWVRSGTLVCFVLLLFRVLPETAAGESIRWAYVEPRNC
jgi:hypothetical protein